MDNKQTEIYMSGQQDLSARSKDELNWFCCSSVFYVMND